MSASHWPAKMHQGVQNHGWGRVGAVVQLRDTIYKGAPFGVSLECKRIRSWLGRKLDREPFLQFADVNPKPNVARSRMSAFASCVSAKRVSAQADRRQKPQVQKRRRIERHRPRGANAQQGEALAKRFPIPAQACKGELKTSVFLLSNSCRANFETTENDSSRKAFLGCSTVRPSCASTAPPRDPLCKAKS
jgi:hypothetical protein